MYPQQILHWIEDAEVASATGATFEKRSPIDDRVVAAVTRGCAADVSRAVGVAAAAADAWARTPAPRRGEILGRAAALLRAKERELGEIVQTETGKPFDSNYAARKPVNPRAIARRRRSCHRMGRPPGALGAG
jgi:acyl-CoA reductase-like NAD-dependent aldehyde dehydrogenase